ncbi:predicted protein [Histoplasma mississippiense (nom. inval.)]|uniref:predicted protein n=1 Tax=Ajellomyces capsulatus (strain NAm1 / WU24) TaxID=2059318 RepID=UPI000157BD41|nr:predicted protein [Histoplasma mississippiense (nom. inval.)]EDN05928.1 predicted protein [Histoplasma mississippiense (nom. inval.)]
MAYKDYRLIVSSQVKNQYGSSKKPQASYLAEKEDKAPSHDHYIQCYMYNIHGIQQLLWCGNSPDLNAIEAAWPWMKRRTMKKGAPKNHTEAVRVWEQAWKDLPQEKIQAWIERIPVHIQKIIELEGGNEYREGRRHGQVEE